MLALLAPQTYHYYLHSGDVCDPLARRVVAHVRGALDLHAMAQAAALLQGTHDFTQVRGAQA